MMMMMMMLRCTRTYGIDWHGHGLGCTVGGTNGWAIAE